MLLWCSNNDMVVYLMGLCDANVSLWDGQFDCLVDVCLTILAWNLNCDLLLVRNLSSKSFIPHRCGWLCCVALSLSWGQVAFTSKALCEQGLCMFSGRNSKSIVASDAMHPRGMAIPGAFVPQSWWQRVFWMKWGVASLFMCTQRDGVARKIMYPKGMARLWWRAMPWIQIWWQSRILVTFNGTSLFHIGNDCHCLNAGSLLRFLM